MQMPDDVCRTCGGVGYFTERISPGQTRTTVCHVCNGTGFSSRPMEDFMRTIVILGSADIELGARLCEAYGCSGLIVPFVQGQYAYGYLHMTTLDPKALLLVKGVEFIDVDTAVRELHPC